MVRKIDETQFEQVRSDALAFVDFSAQWCGPCQMLKPVAEELSEEYNGKVAFYNVDVDECPNLAKEFGIMSIPMVGIFKDGKMTAHNVGFVPKDSLKNFIDSNI